MDKDGLLFVLAHNPKVGGSKIHPPATKPSTIHVNKHSEVLELRAKPCGVPSSLPHSCSMFQNLEQFGTDRHRSPVLGERSTSFGVSGCMRVNISRSAYVRVSEQSLNELHITGSLRAGESRMCKSEHYCELWNERLWPLQTSGREI